MIDTSPYQQCECLRMGNTHQVCKGELTLEERGKKVTLTPRANEEAKALVELKGAGDIPHAFEQLAYTKKHRAEYQHFRQNLEQSGVGQLKEMAFIVTNGMLSKPDREKLENQHGIRVNEVLVSEATKKVPNLREYF